AAMGWFGMSVILGPALGPTLGGILIEHFNWRYIFYIAMPVSAAGILLGSIFLPEREETRARTAFDWTGFLLLAVSLGTVLTGLSNGQREGWLSDFIVSMFAIATVAGVAFTWWELRAPRPLVELRVLASGEFAAAAAVACLFGAGLFGSTYLVPLFVQTVQGYTPLAAGLLLMPAGLMLGVLMPCAGYLSDRVPSQVLIFSGLFCFAVSAYALADIDVNTSFWAIAWCVVLSRIGLALIKPSLNVTALRALPSQLLSQGAGMINFTRQLGGAFGVNLLSVMLDRRAFFHSDTLTATQTSANSATSEMLRAMEGLLAQAGVAEDLLGPGALHFLGRVIYAQAYTLGFRDSFLVVAFVFMLGFIPAWIMARSRGRKVERQAAAREGEELDLAA
ncbi:MAG: DHA2 family efflux MFS transporter permease subunit, partial [Rhodospirillaceae bacterium]